MEHFVDVILVSAVLVLLFKLREADRKSRGRETASLPDLDRVLQALTRLEKKVDRLAFRSQAQVATEIVQAQSVPEAASPVMPAEAAPTLHVDHPVQEATPAITLPPESSAGPGPSPRAEIPASVPREPSAWEKEARIILGRIWSWILVGEEHRPKRMPLEFAMAGTWLMRVGIVVLVFCVAWFLKWSMAHGVLGPGGRVGLSFAAGAALLAVGFRQIGKRYQVLGQGLMGGGLAALYFAAYASGPMYHLLPQFACFAMLALITAAGCVLASVTRSQSIAILAMLGGYAVPVLLSTGVPNFPGLYAYLFLLGGGILALALLRNWRLLHYLAFAAHWFLVFGSLRDYRADRDFHVVLPFLIAFFLQQHGVAVGYALRRTVAISLLEAIHQLALSALFAGLGYRLIDQASGRPWPALLAIGLGLLYVGQTLAVLRRLPGDRLSISVSLGMAGFFTAWSVPLITIGTTLTMAWSLMALAWLWIGIRIRSRLLVMGSQALFILAGARLALHDLGQAYLAGPTPRNWSGYWRGFVPRILNSGVFIGSLFFASRWYAGTSRDASAEGSWRLSPRADLPYGPPPGPAGIAVFFAGLSALFVALHFEAARLLSLHASLLSPGLGWLWALFAAFLAWRLRRFADSPIAKSAAAAAIAAVCVRLALMDWPAVGLAPDIGRFRPSGEALLLRTLAHATLLASMYALAAGKAGPRLRAGEGRVYGILATGFLFLILTLETRTLAYAFFPGFLQGAVSLLWALFAMGLVAAGLRKGDRTARLAGLALFAGVTGKVFLADLKSLEMLWRVLSFMTVGSVLLLGSFAYLRAGSAGETPADAGGENGKSS